MVNHIYYVAFSTRRPWYFCLGIFLLCCFATGCFHFSACNGRCVVRPVTIAVGSLVSVSTNGFYGSAQYYIRSVLRGGQMPDSIEVLFDSSTLARHQIPENGILILEHRDLYPEDVFFAVGRDASRGIINNTAINRARIAKNPASFTSTSRQQWLPQATALKLSGALVSQRENMPEGVSLRMDARRYAFGWDVTVFFLQPDGGQIIGDELNLRIGDDGLLKQYDRGI